MPHPHEINLRGPWQYQVLETARGTPAALSGRISLPASWAETLGADFRGRVKYTRSFAAPTNIAAQERVWLLIDGVDHTGVISLNGVELARLEGYLSHTSLDVTDRLKPRNELVVEIALPEDPEGKLPRCGRHGRAGGLLGEVRLEVRQHLFLEPLRFCVYLEQSPTAEGSDATVGEASQILDLQGRVGGHAGDEEDLALLVTVARQEVLFEGVVPHEQFHFKIPVLGLPVWQARKGRAGEEERADGSDLVEVALVAGGVALWQMSRRTWCRQLPSEPMPVPDVKIVDFPDEPPTVDLLRRTLGAPIPRHILCERILPDAYYDAFDDMGLCVLQPQASVGNAGALARLASHPSIIFSPVPAQSQT